MNAEQREPRLLIVETSGRTGEVALAAGPVIVQHRLWDETRLHARDLAPAVGAMLVEAGWKPADIQGLIINRGPGSYTGLRVGIMSAKALAYATGCSLIAVDGFAAMAAQAPVEVTQLDVIADAQQDRIYQQRFARSAGSPAMKAISPLAIIRFEDWVQSLSAGAWVCGPALRTFRTRLPAQVRTPDEHRWDPHPPILLALGLAKYLAGERDDSWMLEPLYLRPCSAEEKITSTAQGARGPS
jgi:tRNA threonylcarbamoyladenosine biosynthesis protein TsaB